MTSDSAEMFGGVLRALGPNPPVTTIEAVATALRDGPQDLARELTLAGESGPAGRAAWQRVAAVVGDQASGSGFVALDLVTEIGAPGALRRMLMRHGSYEAEGTTDQTGRRGLASQPGTAA